MTLTEQQRTEFEAVTRPVIEWLNNNCHPHVAARIEPTSAELVEGVTYYPYQRLRARLKQREDIGESSSG